MNKAASSQRDIISTKYPIIPQEAAWLVSDQKARKSENEPQSNFHISTYTSQSPLLRTLIKKGLENGHIEFLLLWIQ